MRHFDCNSPDITGYSVASDGAKVLSIISHKSGEKPAGDMYNIPHRGICFWMYMPVNSGEHLTEIGRLVGRMIIGDQIIGITVGLGNPDFCKNWTNTVVLVLYESSTHCCIRDVR